MGARRLTDTAQATLPYLNQAIRVVIQVTTCYTPSPGIGRAPKRQFRAVRPLLLGLNL